MMVMVEFSGEMFTVTVAKSCFPYVGHIGQWRRDSSADVLQISIGHKVLIIQLRFFWKFLNLLVRFLKMKRGVAYYGLGVFRFKEMPCRSHVKLRTTFIHDLRKTFSDHNRQHSIWRVRHCN